MMELLLSQTRNVDYVLWEPPKFRLDGEITLRKYAFINYDLKNTFCYLALIQYVKKLQFFKHTRAIDLFMTILNYANIHCNTNN